MNAAARAAALKEDRQKGKPQTGVEMSFNEQIAKLKHSDYF